MKENFTYRDVPKGYLHCQNAECSRSSECLRFKAGSIVNESAESISIVNPQYVEKQKKCKYFQLNQPVRFAYGISHLYDDLSHTKYPKIKKAIHDYFGHDYYLSDFDKEVKRIKGKDSK